MRRISKADAERFHTLETGDAQLDRLRGYLSDWQDWELRYRVDLGVPNAVPWARYMKDYAPSGDNEASHRETINIEAMRIIDAGMDELQLASPELSTAIRWRYLNVSVQAQVFRTPRLAGLSLEALDDLADTGERALLPIVKRRGLLL